MTAFLPTTRVTVRRGVLEANEWGDELPSLEAIATGVPAAVVDGVGQALAQQVTYQPTVSRGGVVEEFTIRLRPGTDVTEDDRLVDERSGAVYQVRAVFNPQSAVGLTDVRVIAARTGAASQAVNA